MKPKRNKIQVNYAILPATIEKLRTLCKATFRSQGQMIDVLVSDAYDQYEQAQLERSVTASLPESIVKVS